MALYREVIFFGREVLLFLLIAQLLFFCVDVIISILISHWNFIVAFVFSFLIFTLNMIVALAFALLRLMGKRHHYSYTWCGYTGLLIVDIIVVFTLNMPVTDPKKDDLFGPTAFVTVLCITPFILLLFLNTAGERGTEFHGESGWLFATMTVQIFDAIDMIDNILNDNGNGTPKGFRVEMISLALGCLLLAAWEFLELAHHLPGGEDGAKVYRLIVLILVNLATLIIRAVVFVDYGWRETTSIAKNIIMICTSVLETCRCTGQTSLDEVQLGP